MKSSREWARSTLSPFRHDDFRRFYLAQSLSLMGTWAHDLARAWIIVEMMGKSSALGSMLLAAAIPGLLFTLHGGAFVDRFNVRKIMMATKGGLAIASLLLACFVEFSNVQLWHFWVYAIVEGTIVAFDSPTFQTLIVRLVPRSDFQQAIALNSMNFHAARMLGPIIAGTLMHFHGPSLVFLFDGLSFLGVIAVLWNLNIKHAPAPNKKQDTAFLLGGITYIWNDRFMRLIVAQLFLTIAILTPVMMVVFRTYLAVRFNLTGAEFGYLAMYPALGSMSGAVGFALLKPKRPLRALGFGIPLATLAMYLVLFIPSALGASLIMGLAGFGLYLCLAAMTVSVHLRVDESYRGRVSSLVGMGFISIGPLMGYPVGLLADTFGFKTAVLSLVTLFVIVSAVLGWLHKSLGIDKSETNLGVTT